MSSGMFLSYGYMPRMTDFDLQNGASLGDTTPSKANKMSEIPEETEWSKFSSDIMNSAAECVEQMPHRPPFKDDVMLATAKAIWAERQRNAKIADQHVCGGNIDDLDIGYNAACEDISQAILNQTEE